jgi:hypothetical protein
MSRRIYLVSGQTETSWKVIDVNRRRELVAKYKTVGGSWYGKKRGDKE